MTDSSFAFDGPAVVINKFMVVVHPGGAVRLAFGEEPAGGGKAVFRQAAFMSVNDALELAGLLQSVIAQASQPPAGAPSH